MSTNSQPVTLAISGMSCGHCVAAVKSALAAVPGLSVRDVAVGSATVTLEPQTPPDTVIEAVREAGYEARVVAGDSTTASRPS